MLYNVALHSQVNSNTTIGNVSLTSSGIVNLLRDTDAGYPTLSNDDILCLDCDLGGRVKISEVRYYFSSATAPASLIPGIDFYYKDEDFDLYVNLDTFSNGTYYYATISGSPSAPRYIRLKHTISGTGYTGEVEGFQVMNDDGDIDFGTDGSTTSESFQNSLIGSQTLTKTIAIYNDNSATRTAHILIEPQGNVADDALSISLSSSGPWYGPKDTANTICDSTLWNTGVFSNTEIVNSALKLTAGSSVGTYITRVFGTEDNEKFTYLNLSADYTATASGIWSIISTDSDDTQETIEIKSSNTQPKDYITYRKLIYSSSYIYYRDYWLEDGATKFTSTGRVVSADHDSISDNRARFYVDKVNRKSFILFRWDHNTYDYYVSLSRMGSDSSREASVDLVSDKTNNGSLDVFSLKGHANDGVWFYAYFNYNYNVFNSGAGYYLMHYDESMNRDYRLYDSSAFIYDMDPVYGIGDLWYTDQEANQVVKLDTSGNVLGSYSFVDSIKGIVAADDGSCWVIQGKKIFHINSTATGILLEIDLTDDSPILSRIEWADDESFWITDDTSIKRMFLDGRIAFSLDLEFVISDIQAYDSGVACFCIDRSWRFVSKYDRRVIKTITNSNGYNMHVGVEGAEYNNTVYADEFPTAKDEHWPTLTWSTVPVSYYNMTTDKYNQIKLTLRANPDNESPIVYGLYLQDSIMLEDIYAQNYKNIYMKSDVSDLVDSDSGDYISNLKVWWYVPV